MFTTRQFESGLGSALGSELSVEVPSAPLVAASEEAAGPGAVAVARPKSANDRVKNGEGKGNRKQERNVVFETALGSRVAALISFVLFRPSR